MNEEEREEHENLLLEFRGVKAAWKETSKWLAEARSERDEAEEALSDLARRFYSQQQEIDRLRVALTDLAAVARPHLKQRVGEVGLQIGLLKIAIEVAEAVLEPQEEKVCPECENA